MEEMNRVSVGRWAGRRALSTPTAAIIMIVVILVVGGLGYVGLNSAQPGVVTKSSCEPATSAQCSQGSAAHDITLQVPFRSVQQGNPVPFAATLPGGETATSYNFTYGDGTSSGTVTTEANAEVLSMDIVSLPVGGMMTRMAWGSTTRRMTLRRAMPRALPAST